MRRKNAVIHCVGAVATHRHNNALNNCANNGRDKRKQHTGNKAQFNVHYKVGKQGRKAQTVNHVVKPLYADFEAAVHIGKQNNQEQIRKHYKVVALVREQGVLVACLPRSNKNAGHGNNQQNLLQCYKRFSEFK